jgi:hypothetical protein
MFDVRYIIIALSGLRCADRHYTTFVQFQIIMHQKLGQEWDQVSLDLATSCGSSGFRRIGSESMWTGLGNSMEWFRFCLELVQ